MTIATWIALGGVLLSLLINGAGWLVAWGRQAAVIDGLKKDMAEVKADCANLASAADVADLRGRVDDLERDAQEVPRLKASVEALSGALSSEIRHFGERMADSQQLVSERIGGLDRLMTARLDEVTSTVRLLAQRADFRPPG